MFSNYFKIAFRNLLKRKGYSLLNILGLTVGMTCCLLIFHYVSYEKSYEDFNPKAKDIVRLRLDNYQKGQLAWKSATVYPAIAPGLKKEYPEVEDFCRLHDAELLLVNPERNVKFSETKGYYADPSALNILQVNLTEGRKDKALEGPDKMVLSQTMAKKYFGTASPIGKQLLVRDPGGIQSYEVTGVFTPYPANAHLVIDYLVSYATLGKIIRLQGDSSNATETSFGWYDFYSYLQLRPGADKKAFASKLQAFADKHINSMEWYRTNNNRAELHILPLPDIHLSSNYNQEAEVNGSGQAVSFLFLVALFIIGIAWVNYINLATARSVERAKEVGVRKVLGALRSNLVGQFMMESLLLNMVALVLSGIAFQLLLPSFDRFTGRDLLTQMTLTPFFWYLFLTVFLTGTALSGLYPAFVLSSFQPIKVLKGLFKHSSGGTILRKGLIVAQFLISVVLISGTMVVYRQVNYMRSQQLGANISQTLVVKGAGSITDSLYHDVFQPFKQELLQQKNIKTVASSTSVMGDEIYWTSGVTRVDKPGQSAVTLYHLGVDPDFVPSYELKLKAGRNFSTAFKTDEKAVLINEKAAQLLGYSSAEAAVNGYLKRGRDTLKIVGVTADFHHLGLQKPIDPLILLLRPDTRDYYSMKIGTGSIQQTIAAVQSTWKKHFPNDPFHYFFLNESFDRQYKADAFFGKVFGTFALLAILIACFGLLGLSAYNVVQRSKEIGIRKVLGATSRNLLVLLSTDYIKLILVALVLAVPIGWYIMHSWLQDFAYRISIEWWVFTLAGCLSLLVAFITISVQVLKVVSDNPVKSLRTE